MKRVCSFWFKSLFQSSRHKEVQRSKTQWQHALQGSAWLALTASFLMSTALAATFNQTDWGLGAPANVSDCTAGGGTWSGTECLATAPADQVGWQLYGAKDSDTAIANAGADVELASPPRSYIQSSQNDFEVVTNTTVTQIGATELSAGTGNVVINETVSLEPASYSVAWSTVATYAGHDVGTYAKPIFADINNDGVIDALIGTRDGIARGFRNTGTNASPVWVSNNAWNGPDIGAYGSPGLGDLDNDGDLDLLMGGNTDDTSHAFINEGNNTAPIWVAHPAWDTPSVGGFGRAAPRLIDIDDDGDLDLFQGAQSGDAARGYENTGGVTAPIWTPRPEWNTRLPSGELGGYTTPAFGDVDRDGLYDLFIGDGNGNVFGYKNTGSITSPAWAHQPLWDPPQSSSHAGPALEDLNGDGVLDLVIGRSNGTSAVYLNIGTQYALAGQFESSVIDAGYHQGLVSLNFDAVLPPGTSITLDVRSGNVDTPDASWTTWQTGLANGADISAQGFNRYIQYRANLATTNSPPEAQYTTPELVSVTASYLQYPSTSTTQVERGRVRLALTSATQVWSEDTWGPTSVGTRSKPRFVDMNGDGVIDLMIGERFGDVRGIENIGTNDAPIWERRTEWDIVDAVTDWAGAGYADLDDDGDLDAIIANGNGLTYGYRNIGTRFLPAWEAFPAWDLGNIGFNISPDLGDFDGDGDYDLIIGELSNNLTFYENTGSKSGATWARKNDWDLFSGSDSSPAVADLDGDGDLDLIVGLDNGNTRGFENIGDKYAPNWVSKSEWGITTATPYSNKRASPTLMRVGPDWDYDILIGEDTGNNYAYTNQGVRNHEPSGNYHSAVIDLAQYEALTTLDYLADTPVGTTIKVDMRTGTTPYAGDVNWSGWLENIANGGDLSTLPGHRYVQYRLTLETPDPLITPFLDNITINHRGYVAAASLTSSPFDTNQVGTLIKSLSWNETLPANTNIQIQMRAANDNAGAPDVWTEWMGPDGSASTFWDSSNTHNSQCDGVAAISCSKIPAKLRNGINAQWFQYRVTLRSDGVSTPTLADIEVEFNTANTGGTGGFNISAISNNTSEDETTATFTVALSAAPLADVSFGVYTNDASEGHASPGGLTFTTGNWNTAQTVTVIGIDDVIDDGDMAYNVVLGAAVSTDSNYDDRNPSDVALSNIDNDTSSFIFSPNSGLLTNESGGTANISVTLSSQPSDNVTISFASSLTSEGVVEAPATLVFTPDNWSLEQEIVVTGQDDAGIIDGNIDYWIETGIASSPGDSAYNNLNPPDISATNIDNDKADILVYAPHGLVTSERGGIAPIAVALTTAPTDPVLVEFVYDFTATEGFIDPFTAQMTFTPSNWDQPQESTIYGVNDWDVDGNQAYTIETNNFVSDDINYGGTKPIDIQVLNLDDDAYEVRVTPSSGLETSEDGGSATFNVQLGGKPSQDVTINLTSSDTSEGVLQTSSITFTSSGSSWRGIPVTVLGQDDREMDFDMPYHITLDVVTDDPNYTSMTIPNVELTNVDNNRSTRQHIENDIANSYFGYRVAHADVNCDTIPDLLVSASGINDEVYAFHGTVNGYSNTPDWVARDSVASTDFGSGLASAGDINQDGCDDILIGAPRHSSYKGAAYLFMGSASGLADADSDGIASPSDAAWRVFGDYNNERLGVSFAAGDFDNNTYSDIAIAAERHSNDFGSEGRIFVFTNTAGSLANINGDGIALPSEASWVFDGGIAYGYAGADQGLAVANVNGDAYDDLLIGVRGGGSFDEGRIYAFYGSATLFNDLDGDGVAKSSDADWAAESDEWNARMDSVANGGDLNGDGVDDIILGASDYGSSFYKEGAVFVFYGNAPNGLPDPDGDSIAHPADADWQLTADPDFTSLGHWVSSAGDFNGDGYNDIIVGASSHNANLDSKGAAFVFSGGASGLSSTPTWTMMGDHLEDSFGHAVGNLGDVDNDGFPDLYVSAYRYGTYTSGAADKLDEGAVFVYLSSVQTPGLSVTSVTGLETTESGGEASFSVVLDAPPTADVTITVSSNNTAEGIPSPAQLTFNLNNWNVPQTVQVTGQNDALVDNDTPYQVSFAVTASADGDYSALPATNLVLVNIDNEVTPAVSVVAVSGSESEGGSITFSHTGEIDSPINVNYTIGGTATPGVDYPSLSGDAVIPVGSPSITLPVPFTLDALIESNETIIINVTSGPDYIIGVANTTLTIMDDDTAGVVLSPNFGLVTSEAGDMENIGLRLTSQPDNNVTVNLASSAELEAIVTPSSVVFTPTDWSVEQFVTVIGQDDILVDGDQSFVVNVQSVDSLDGNYSGLVVAGVSGTNRDDDALATVSLSTGIATITEGEVATDVLTFTRSGATATELQVFYTVSGTALLGDDYTRYSGTAVIPAGAASASLNLTTVQDSIAEGDENIVITLAPASTYIVGSPSMNSITIIDDDSPESLAEVNFSLNQATGEGRLVTVAALLNKPAATYPVTVPYTIAGTADNPADHNAVDGNIVIASGLSGSISFNVIDDGASGETDELLAFNMGSPTNAMPGYRTEHIVRITENNIPPHIDITSEQGGVEARLIVTTAGNVSITATIDDPNPGDTHEYDWLTLSNNNLVDIDDADPLTFVFNPGGLLAGFYKVGLTVTENGQPEQSTSIALLLEVVASAPSLTAADTDSDGIADNAESFDDSDGDGLADYLDSADLAANELQVTLNDSVSYIMKTEQGLSLALGDVAFAAGADGAQVSTDDIAAYGGGEGNAGVASAEDTVASPGGYFDFVVTGLPEAGQSVKVVIPQLSAIPDGASYRKYDPDLGWRDFSVDANNKLASAPGTPGHCPAPGDSSYSDGLTPGHYCMQLTIEDGGANDADGEVNNIIEDPGSIIEAENAQIDNTATNNNSGGGGGGAWNLYLLLIFLAFVSVARYRYHIISHRHNSDLSPNILI